MFKQSGGLQTTDCRLTVVNDQWGWRGGRGGVTQERVIVFIHYGRGTKLRPELTPLHPPPLLPRRLAGVTLAFSTSLAGAVFVSTPLHQVFIKHVAQKRRVNNSGQSLFFL